MGMLIDGQWKTEDQFPSDDKGRFTRKESVFRNWITRDGSPGPSGEGGFEAESGRYHLYVSYACPWAHRTLILRKLKGLEQHIGVSVVDWFLGDDGWKFSERDGATPDPIRNARFLREIYQAADPDYTGRVTVPTLWDSKRETIVSNESAEIIRMLNSEFSELATDDYDFYPRELRKEIDAINAPIYDRINNGVYKSGFARAQDAYEDAVTALFELLDTLENRLLSNRYLVGDRITEADWRLFTTLVRFDPVYNGHFKCNIRRLVDYPNLWNYTRELYQWPGVAETVNLHHIKNHYYQSHESVNPLRIVPVGPDIDYAAPHDRARLPKAA